MKPFRAARARLIIPVVLVVALAGGAGGALLGSCGPFLDVSDAAFCPFVLEIFTLGITTGTTATTYDPDTAVNRLQMAAFLSRTVDGVLRRGSRRAALDQFWTPPNSQSLGVVTVGPNPLYVKSDGSDLWLSDGAGTVSRIRQSDGRILETWTGASNPLGVLVAMGRVFVAGGINPGVLYVLDPSQPAGAVSIAATGLGQRPGSITFDGARVWTANSALNNGSVSIITPGPTMPWTVTTVTTGFQSPGGFVFDGAHVWMTDVGAGTLLKLDENGAILQTVTIGADAMPASPAFDGENIWVPNQAAFTTFVIRASTGAVLANLQGNGQNFPLRAAFDGQRVLVVSTFGNTLSLWKASDLAPLGNFSFPSGTHPFGVCSDGVNFWITFTSIGQLARF